MKYSLIVWHEGRNTGINFIDEQHRGIVSLINTLHFFNTQNESSYIIERTIDLIDQYMKLHFHAEETLFKRYQYPEYEEHKSEHIKVIKFMSEEKSKYASSADYHTYMVALKEWWIDHTENFDRSYVPFLKSSMEKPAFR